MKTAWMWFIFCFSAVIVKLKWISAQCSYSLTWWWHLRSYFIALHYAVSAADKTNVMCSCHAWLKHFCLHWLLYLTSFTSSSRSHYLILVNLFRANTKLAQQWLLCHGNCVCGDKCNGVTWPLKSILCGIQRQALFGENVPFNQNQNKPPLVMV